MYKVLSSVILSFGVFFVSNAQHVTSIDLTRAKIQPIHAERIFEEFEFVSLETHEDALLDVKTATYYLTDKYIIGVSFLRGAYLFDRATGAFIREIGSLGQGPDEYIGWIANRYGFDEENNSIYATDGGPSASRGWKGINIESNKVESIIKRPLPENNNELFSAYMPWRIKENLYVSFSNNRTGKDNIRLIIFDKEGRVINKYPNYLEYDKGGSISNSFNNGIFYYYKDLTYFKEWAYNDTVFCVTPNNMTPHIIFKSGNKQPSYYYQNDDNHNREKYLINFVYESDLYVFFNFLYNTETTQNIHVGYYDKKQRQAYISSTADLRKTGYIMDGIPVGFCPVSINKNKEMIAAIDPVQLIEYKDRMDPKYKRLFQNVREDDNPIIVIAKIKD